MLNIRVSISWKKGLKNNLEKYFLKKNSPFAKRIFVHALSRDPHVLSDQPWHLRLIWSAKLVKAELSQFQLDMNLAK